MDLQFFVALGIGIGLVFLTWLITHQTMKGKAKRQLEDAVSKEQSRWIMEVHNLEDEMVYSAHEIFGEGSRRRVFITWSIPKEPDGQFSFHGLLFLNRDDHFTLINAKAVKKDLRPVHFKRKGNAIAIVHD